MILNHRSKKSSTAILIALLASCFLIKTTIAFLVQQSQSSNNPNFPDQTLDQQPQANQQVNPASISKLHQEILVQPNSRVKIACKLPQVVANGSGKYYWNFQRSSLQDQKPDLLCFERTCIVDSSYGINLDANQSDGAYDLIINNATYELNDGMYYCAYRDTESRASINQETRLTVLCKYPPDLEILSYA